MRIKKLRKFLSNNFNYDIQVFDTRSDEETELVYDEDNIQVYYSKENFYIEIVGLSCKEFNSIVDQNSAFRDKLKCVNKDPKYKFLFLMGGSGCGKTTLAIKLEEYDPVKFYRSIEYSTRQIRSNEKNGFDYYFISVDEINKLSEKEELFEKVFYQFPDKYGCNFSEIKDDKINVVIVSIEGFLSAAKILKNLYPSSESVLVNIINDCPLDIQREGRDPLQEERVNKSVIYNLNDNLIHDGKTVSGYLNNPIWHENIYYTELPLSHLKEVRNNKELTLEYFNGLFK